MLLLQKVETMMMFAKMVLAHSSYDHAVWGYHPPPTKKEKLSWAQVLGAACFVIVIN